MKGLAVFAAVAVADVLWTLYILATSERRAALAAWCSTGIVLAAAFTTLAYVEDPRYLLPAGLGAWIGTYVTVRRG
jgi:hypothetical protein